jgi:hypothetical protein
VLNQSTSLRVHRGVIIAFYFIYLFYFDLLPWQPFPCTARSFGLSQLGLSRLIPTYFLSHNTIHSTSRAIFLESAERALRLHHLFSKYVFMSSAGSGWHDLWPAWPLSTSSSRSRCITDLQRSIVSSTCRIQRRPLQHRRLALGTTPGCVPGYLDEISSAIARADGHVFTPPPFQPCLHPQAKCQFQLNIFTISI